MRRGAARRTRSLAGRSADAAKEPKFGAKAKAPAAQAKASKKTGTEDDWTSL